MATPKTRGSILLDFQKVVATRNSSQRLKLNCRLKTNVANIETFSLRFKPENSLWLVTVFQHQFD